MLPFTGVAIMQLVERGKLTLDADIAPLVPDFPLQGHHVTVRELLNHTSGVVDYHYLGDAIDGTSRTPRSLPELIALFSNCPWVHDPGTTWDWSISGFALLASIVEKVSGLSYDDYPEAEHLRACAGLKSTALCDDFTFTCDSRHGYRRCTQRTRAGRGKRHGVQRRPALLAALSAICTRHGAAARAQELTAQSLALMSTAVGPTLKMSPDRPGHALWARAHAQS